MRSLPGWCWWCLAAAASALAGYALGLAWFASFVPGGAGPFAGIADAAHRVLGAVAASAVVLAAGLALRMGGVRAPLLGLAGLALLAGASAHASLQARTRQVPPWERRTGVPSWAEREAEALAARWRADPDAAPWSSRVPAEALLSAQAKAAETVPRDARASRPDTWPARIGARYGSGAEVTADALLSEGGRPTVTDALIVHGADRSAPWEGRSTGGLRDAWRRDPAAAPWTWILPRDPGPLRDLRVEPSGQGDGVRVLATYGGAGQVRFESFRSPHSGRVTERVRLLPR